jgi:hypothetical protein
VHPTAVTHRGSDPLSRCSLFLAGMNLDSRAYYIGADGGAHYPLIEGIVPDQGGEVDLVPCGPSP